MNRQQAFPFGPGTNPTATPMGLRTRGLGLALGLTGASLVWLGLSSGMATAGHRISELESARGRLVEQRIALLLSHAAATDPGRIQAQALAMGFQPMSEPEHLTVRDERALPVADAGRPEQALAIIRRAGAPADHVNPQPDLGGMLVEMGAAAPAHADEVAQAGSLP